MPLRTHLFPVYTFVFRAQDFGDDDEVSTEVVAPTLSDIEREAIIADALESSEGRQALAMSMVEPIRRSLEYQAVGRRILMVDELPTGALARYERDVAAVAHVVRRGDTYPIVEFGEQRTKDVWTDLYTSDYTNRRKKLKPCRLRKSIEKWVTKTWCDVEEVINTYEDKVWLRRWPFGYGKTLGVDDEL